MKSKRILSLLLVLGMLASMLPSALAADVSDFTDVSESDWYYEYVDYVAEKGYFQGTSATTFSPAVTMTRAMFVTAVSRVAGETGDAGTAPFDDVPAGTWYTAAVDWATEHGVINGVGGNKFAPEREITREEMCVIMARFIAYLEESQKKTFKKDADPIDFPDADQIADYAKEAVDDCVAYGLVFGTGAGLMAPRALASRAEVAAMIYRLSLMTTESTGGGGGGGGGGPVGPTATSYTITFMNGTETVGTVTTASNTSAEKSFTTLAAPVQAGDVFINWNTAADGTGEAYAASTEYTATGNMTLYAQWIDDEDYIGKAVMAAMEQFNADYLSKADVSYEGSSASVEPVVFNGAIDPANTRKQTMTASASVSEDLVVKIIEKAAEYAVASIGWVGNDKPLKEDIDSLIDSIITDIEKIIGVELPDISTDTSLEDVKNWVYGKVTAAGKSLWENFYDENGDYYTGDVTVSAGSASAVITVDQENHTTTYAGSKREAMKNIGVALAREMYAGLKGNTEYTNEVELTGTLTFDFKDNLEAGYGTATATYPHVYPIEVGLTLDGGELVEYKFDGKSFVKLNVTTAVQDTYEQQLDAVIREALGTETVKNELEPRIESTIETFMGNSTFDALANAMVQVGAAADSAEAQDTIRQAMSAWQSANMDLDDLANSPLFQIYWEQDPNAAYNNNAIYNLVGTVANAAAEFVNNELDEIAGGNFMLQAMVDAAKKTANPADLEDVLLDEDFNIDIDAILGLNDYPEIKNYALAVISDYLNAQIPGNTDYNWTEAAAPAMHTEMDDLVRGAIEDTNYYDYLLKAVKLQKVETMADLQLGNLATLLRKQAFLDYVDGRGASLLDRVTNLIGRLPEGASVEMNGVTLNKAALAGIQAADTTVEACGALADLIDQDGLRDLTLNSFSGEGMEITVRYNARTFTFNLVVDIA